jgi:hypothetical protein
MNGVVSEDYSVFFFCDNCEGIQDFVKFFEDTEFLRKDKLVSEPDQVFDKLIDVEF